jgi:biotin transport system substrate-specific component
VLRLLGPTGGYLLAYPAAAAVTGALARRGTGYGARLVAALAGMATLYAGGLAQLAVLTGSAATAAAVGALPFAAADVVKALVAAAVAPRRPGATRAS